MNKISGGKKMNRNKVDYVMKKYIVNKDNLDNIFAQYPTKRKIRKAQEKRLVEVLKKGKSFPVMYVNRGSRLTNKLLVLDGNHRVEALRQFFISHPNKSVELQVGVFDISDPELERKKFLELNTIVKPSSDDIIQQYKNDLPFLKDLLDQLDDLVGIYNSRPLKVRNIIHSYIHAIKKDWNATIIDGKELVKHMESYGQGNIDEIKKFLEFYQDTFGVLTKDSKFVKTTVLQVLFRLWYQNKDRIDKTKMQNKLRKLMLETIFIEASQKGGNGAVMEYADKFIDFLNRGRNYNFVLEKPSTGKTFKFV